MSDSLCLYADDTALCVLWTRSYVCLHYEHYCAFSDVLIGALLIFDALCVRSLSFWEE